MVNLKEKSFIRDGIAYIKNGVPAESYKMRVEPVTIPELEMLYQEYKNSFPNEEEMRRKNYFKALPIEELSHKALISGVSRTKAREDLELTLLLGILNGSLTWETFGNKGWFWQSQSDRDFVILKEWVV